jgi:hypothetical protein
VTLPWLAEPCPFGRGQKTLGLFQGPEVLGVLSKAALVRLRCVWGDPNQDDNNKVAGLRFPRGGLCHS